MSCFVGLRIKTRQKYLPIQTSLMASFKQILIHLNSSIVVCLLSVVCCQVEVSATGWSLVQGSPTDCGSSSCVIKKPRKRGGLSPLLGCENTITMGCNARKTNNN